MYTGWSPRARYVLIQVTHPGTVLPSSGIANCAIMVGSISMEEAKMMGITPAMLTFSGMYVLVPPMVRRPTMRLAYCTGMRRCDCSTKTTQVMTTSPIAHTPRKMPQPRVRRISPSADGKVAAMDVKISRDMPLPTPRSVMRSPSHMITVVPAVMVRIMMTSTGSESSGMIGSEQLPSRFPERAREMTVVALRAARPIVR